MCLISVLSSGRQEHNCMTSNIIIHYSSHSVWLTLSRESTIAAGHLSATMFVRVSQCARSWGRLNKSQWFILCLTNMTVINEGKWRVKAEWNYVWFFFFIFFNMMCCLYVCWVWCMNVTMPNIFYYICFWWLNTSQSIPMFAPMFCRAVNNAPTAWVKSMRKAI